MKYNIWINTSTGVYTIHVLIGLSKFKNKGSSIYNNKQKKAASFI